MSLDSPRAASSIDFEQFEVKEKGFRMTYRQVLSKCRALVKGGWESWITSGGEIRLRPPGSVWIATPLQAICCHETGVSGNDSIEGVVLTLRVGPLVAQRIAAASECRGNELRTLATRRTRRDLLKAFRLTAE
ncbi:MAG TPA: hypothetical protein VJH94_01775 [Candidatus Paceibacterota bacterium]